MPGSLLMAFGGWVASHGIAITLAVFVIVGLNLAGLTPEPPSLATYPTDAPDTRSNPVSREPRPPAPREASAPVVPAAEQGRAKVTSAPRLIGGSIPVRPDPRRHAAAGAASADGFRPPALAGEAVPEAATLAALQQNARRAFWNGDFETAERTYMEALTRFPNDADTFGELGNLYLAMGRRQPAMDAFHAAAIRLKSNGDQERVNEIIKILDKEGDPRTLELGP